MGGSAIFVTVGFNPSKALEAIAKASSRGSDVYLIIRRESIEPALRAVRTVVDFAERLGVNVKVLEIDPSDILEVFRLSSIMSHYDRVNVWVGGGLRVIQAYTLLATLNVIDVVEDIQVFDHDTGDLVSIPKWLVNLVTSPERWGRYRVLAALSNEPKTKDEVVAASGLSEQTVSKYLSFLARAKLAKRVIPNKYRITELGERIKNYIQTILRK
mgnify:CR=1 FL=1